MARIKIVERKQPKELTKKVERKKRKEVSMKKAVVVVPRLRLEPTLKPKKDSKKTTEDAKLLSPKQAIVETEKLPDLINFEPAKNSASSTIEYAADEDSNYDSGSLQAKKCFNTPKKGKKNIYNAKLWRDIELFNMTTGLQVYGFHETKKVAELVKTKDENHVEHFINRRTTEIIRIRNNEEKRRGRPSNSWTKVSSEHLPSWPNARKWRRMAHEQMLNLTKMKDYSRSVIADLLQRFYDEEEEPSDPQVINVKAVYKYLLDCLAGKIPPQLPPKESALVLDLLRDARLLPLVYDFKEEKTFLANYKAATKYKPFEIKDEFKRRFSKVNVDMVFDRNCVSVPEEVFMNLSRHKRVVQSFNPLVIPVWMMQKEQEYLEKFI